ncbi:snoRNP complex protein nop56 [Peltigera leucophlebia]|nr:snoRNP complex protein nop56 [Peltigera leucophlebia]
MSINYLLHESPVGYAVFEVISQPDTIGSRLKEVQNSIEDLSKFGKLIKLVGFAPFQGAAQALENANDISEGILSEYLSSVLEVNLPKVGKKKKITLGVSDKNLAGSIKAAFPGVECETGDTSEVVQNILRGIRQHAPKLLKQLQEGDVERAQLGLGHAYSRARVKFSVQKNDNHIIQAIATLDHLDKSINTFSMRVREWYSWHFPELIRIVSENQLYARLALFIGDKKRLAANDLHDLAAQVNDDGEIAQSIIDAARVSMGQDLSQSDMENVTTFAMRVVSLSNYRKSLHGYLVSKMGIVAPNLATLIGEVVGARLISHAGSLTNLCKYPASTVQILGAEKALFRALKTKGNTPKYGLIYHSSFIGRAGLKNKGRVSRFLANKCSIASRIDNFSEIPTTRFGEALKQQVEERLRFYDSGVAPQANELAMRAAMEGVLADVEIHQPEARSLHDDVDMVDAAPKTARKQERQKNDKRDSKEKKEKKPKQGNEDDKKKKRKHDGMNGLEERVKLKKAKQ